MLTFDVECKKCHARTRVQVKANELDRREQVVAAREQAVSERERALYVSQSGREKLIRQIRSFLHPDNQHPEKLNDPRRVARATAAYQAFEELLL